jgi:hypothetical protein
MFNKLFENQGILRYPRLKVAQTIRYLEPVAKAAGVS